MADAKANRPVDEKSLLLEKNFKAAGLKGKVGDLPIASKINPKTRMKEPRQVTRSVRTGNVIETR